MQDDIQRWIDLSVYDLDTAAAMWRSGRYLYVLFCCQQAVEKRLKGLVVQTTQSMPPKTHDLLRLVSLAGVELREEQELFLRKLANYYIATRYPEEVANLATQVTKELARDYLLSTKEILKWLDSLLKQRR